MRGLVCLACVLGLASASTLDMFAPVSEVVENQACRGDSLFYLWGVENNLPWAMRMLDASSKVPSGILMGNWADLGNYDECIDVRDVATTSGHFSGQHCVAMAFLSALPAMALRWSVCIPSSCTYHDLEMHLQSMLPNMTILVTDTACSSSEHTRPLDGADWFAVGFLVFFAVLVLLSTTYDLASTQTESRRPILLSFSVYTNGSKLLNAAPGADSLSSVHGVRFLSMAWVVLGHTYIYAVMTPTTNLASLGGYLTDWKHIFIINGTLSVDSFFLLSGLLVCYVFLKEMDKGASFNLPLYYIHRYIRLTPALAAMMLLTATLFYHMGDGPLWDSNLIMTERFCVDNWWVNLLYINNYFHQTSMCIGQSWYLAVDMQLFWFSPLIIYPLWRWPRVGKAIWAVMVFAGLLTSFLIALINDLPANSSTTGDLNALGIQYYPTHARFTPWLIGIGLGYLLHVAKKTRPRLTPLIAALGWMATAVLLLSSLLFYHRFVQPEHIYNRVGESFYTCFMRPGWALGLAWVIYACTMGYGGFVNTFLSWSFFQVLGRLTYTVYLTHMTVMTMVSSISRTAQYVDDTTLFMQFFSNLVASFAAAFVLSLVFESPAIVIEKALLGKLSTKKKESDGAKKEKPGDDQPDGLEQIESAPVKEQVASVSLKDVEGGGPA